jgi:HEPN domain-containing protein/predicted nucleotidyltransferase
MTTQRVVDPMLEELTQTLVGRFHPDRVILFGSRARGDARDDSDYDIAVEIDAPATRELKLALEAEAKKALGSTVDVHLRRPGDIEAMAEDPGYVDWDIHREGVILYTSPSRASHVRERPAPRSSVDVWQGMARVDLAMIEAALGVDDIPWTGIAFHAQQAAEKYLKAAIISHGIRPERTHNLTDLFDQLESVDDAVPDLRAECELLTPFAIDTRYPRDESSAEMPKLIEAETGERAVAAMRAIVAAVLTHNSS